jgi:hypothetical protein
MKRSQSETQTGRRLVVRPGEAVIGVYLDPESDEITYFASEAEADAAIPESAVQEALALAGVWSDLDAEEVFDALERLRRERKPSPSEE